MTPYEIALSYLGEHEIGGSLHNQVIVAMFASVGHPDILDDETAWCAAFVGHCIELGGLKSTRALTARSYLKWGEAVPDIELAQEGDIVVFKRGNSTWQGHVGFFVGDEGNQIAVLGGNQGDAVSIARYRKDKLLAIRRAPHAPSSDPIVSDPSQPYRFTGDLKR